MSTTPVWIDLHAIKPNACLSPDGRSVHITHIRNATYTSSEFQPDTVEWLEGTYALDDLVRVWCIDNPYGFMQSHCMLTFEFTSGRFLTMSPEVRKTSDTDFEVWHVLYKPYTIFYIVATEHDIVYLRTHIRHTPTYRYELALTEAQREFLFTILCTQIHTTHTIDIPYKLFRTDCIHLLLRAFRQAGITVHKYFFDWSPTRVLLRSGLIRTHHSSVTDVFTSSLINERTCMAKQDFNYSLSATHEASV